MSFDQQLGKIANSPLPTYQRQASVNVTSEHNGGLASPFMSIPSCLPEQGATSHNCWSSTDNTDCEGESDLHHLVSNILDERDSQDGYVERNQLKIEQIWSPKTLKDEFQQYFESDTKTHTSAAFPPNCTYYKSVTNLQEQPVDKDVEEVSQQINGLSTTQPLLFNWLNGNMESYTPPPKSLPPGLPMPNMGNINLSQTEQSKHDYISANNDRENCQPMNNFLDLGKVLVQQSEMSNPCVDLYYVNDSIQSNTKPISDEPNVPQDVSQLVSMFQPVMAAEQNFLNHRESSNTHRQTSEMHQEDIMAEQWEFFSTQMSTQSRPTMPIQKQQAREFGLVHGERNGLGRKQIFKGDSFQDIPGFSPQITEDFQQPNRPSASLNFPKQSQKKLAKHRGNTSLSMNLSMTQYSQHHSQQNQMQNKIKPQRGNYGPPNMSNFLSPSVSDFGPQHSLQMQRGTPCVQDYTNGGAPIHRQPRQDREERSLDISRNRDGDSHMQMGKNRMHMADFLGEGIPARPFTTTSHMSEGDKKQALYQSTYGDCLGSVHRSNSPGFVPLVHPVKDPRNPSYLPYNLSNFSSRPKLPCGKDLGDVSANRSAPLNACIGEMMSGRGEGVYHDTASAKMDPTTNNQKGPEFQLLLSLDECFEQCRHLEEERSKTEIILKKTFPRKWTTAVTTPDVPQIPPKPTKLEQVIVNQIREQRKVASLLDEMEHLCNTPFHANIFSALNTHLEAICVTQARHKEIVNMSSHQRDRRAPFREDRETLLLAVALKDLAVATRKIGSALWCALQITLPKPTGKATCEESCSRPFEEYTLGFI